MNILKYFKNKSWNGTIQGIGMKIAAARPEILLCGGGFLMLAGTVYACCQTDKAKEKIAEYKKSIKSVDEKMAILENVAISKEEDKEIKIEKGREYTKISIKLAWELIKIFGLPAFIWFGGLGMIGKGHSDLRIMNRNYAADIFAGNQLLKAYRNRVAAAVGEENEQKIFLGTQEGTIDVLEKDPETGEETVVQKQEDVFYAQPGSIFARNFNEETCDLFEHRSFWEDVLDKRVNEINTKLEVGMMRAFNGMDILRILGFNENALGEDESVDKLLMYGISGNARKVSDPEMRKLKITKLRGYQKKWDVVRNMFVYVPCLRLDFNFYPLEGKI